MKVADNKARNRMFRANHFKNQKENLKKFDQIFGKLKIQSNFINDDDNEDNKNNDKTTPLSFVATRLRKEFPIEKRFLVSDLKKRHIKPRF